MTERPPTPPDPGRRAFFRRFAGEVVTSVGSVLGAAQALQQESAEAARDLLGQERPTAAAGAAAPMRREPAARPEVDAAAAGFRAPFRWEGDACVVVDQRRLPDVLAELEVRSAAEAVSAINEGAVVGSSVQAQVAAIALALAVARIRTARPYARRASVRGAANALAGTRPGSATMRAAMDRMLAVFEAFAVDAAGDELAAALRTEAEAIVYRATAAHGDLALHGLAALPDTGTETLRAVTLGSTGAMGGGQFGTALSVLVAAHHAQRPVHVLVAETRPGLEGSRVAAWELRQAGVPYAVVTDAAAPAVVAAGEVDVVVVGADRVAANGDAVATAGTYPLALAAAAAGVPVLVCAPAVVIDPGLADGAAAILEQGRPGGVLRAAGTRVAPAGSPVRNPVQDLVPAGLVTAFVTEFGTHRPPYDASLAVAAASSAAAGDRPPMPAGGLAGTGTTPTGGGAGTGTTPAGAPGAG